MSRKRQHEILRRRKASDPPLGWEIPTLGVSRKPETSPGAYGNRCATDDCTGFPLSAGWCVKCGPTAAMLRLMRSLAVRHTTLIGQQKRFSRLFCLIHSDDSTRGCQSEHRRGRASTKAHSRLALLADQVGVQAV